MSTSKTYFKDIWTGLYTILFGMKLTMVHFVRGAFHRRKPMSVADDNYFKQKEGLVTIQYPREKIPVPDNGRYRLHNEADDCIVCDQCARICPVDCITIESIKAVEDLGVTSDGSKKRLWMPVFDIDMAKCCYCGLCTTVCPTECLTMTKVYDFSEFDRDNLIYHFGNLTPQQAAEKRKMLEEEKKKIASAKAAASEPAPSAASTETKTVREDSSGETPPSKPGGPPPGLKRPGK